MSFVKDLNTPLLRLSADDVFTLDQACTGVHVFGGIGSGKTSGSGAMLSGAYLRAGMGGVVTAVKPGDIALWQRYTAQHGREKSLILFDENEGFNFLSYELGRQGIDGIGTVTECLMRVLEAAKRTGIATSQRGEEAFWENSTRMLLRYSIMPLYAAQGSLSIADIIRFVSSAPESRKDMMDPEWQKSSFLYSVLDRAMRRPRVAMPKETLALTLEYWSDRWLATPEKTRGNQAITIGAVLDRFLHGRLQRAFCGKTTLVPELSFHGAVILLAMPTLTWNEDGIIAQQIFKYFWQRSVLNRNSLAEKHRERPVFLFSDESQETVSSYDGEFLGMCRDSKCCVTYLTQSLPTYYAKIGGDNPQHATTGLVGKFKTHIYHSNSCPDTNEYASRMIGKVVKRRNNYNSGSSQNYNYGMSEGSSHNSGSSSSYGSSHSNQGSSGNSGSGHNSGSGSNWGSNQGRGTSENESRGYSETLENAIEPGDFARVLKTGGKQNGNQVTGVWFQSGRVFKASNSNMLLETFDQ